jgi:hypothetical protein
VAFEGLRFEVYGLRFEVFGFGLVRICDSLSSSRQSVLRRQMFHWIGL